MPAVTSRDDAPVAAPSGSPERSPGDVHPASTLDAVSNGPNIDPAEESPWDLADPAPDLQIVHSPGTTGNGYGGSDGKRGSGDGGSGGTSDEGGSDNEEEEEWEDWEDVGGGAALETLADELTIEIDEQGVLAVSATWLGKGGGLYRPGGWTRAALQVQVGSYASPPVFFRGQPPHPASY